MVLTSAERGGRAGRAQPLPSLTMEPPTQPTGVGGSCVSSGEAVGEGGRGVGVANKPARPCLAPGCPAISRTGSRCPRHQQANDQQRGSSTERGYGSAWQRTRLRILNRDGWLCGYCGLPATTVDHRTPKARGGTDDDGNLIAACLPCNSGKRDR